MNTHYTYLLIDIATLLCPFVLSFDKKVAFFKLWRWMWPGMLLTGAFFIAWDVLFTQQGVWAFNDKYILGVKIVGLPIEEWLFFLVVPYSCTFIYECLLCYLPFREQADWGWQVLLGLGVVLLITGFAYTYKAYTFTTFSFCGFTLLLLYFFRHKIPSFHAAAFLVCFAISLVPFLIVNGFLTSLPVVSYNDAENLGLRIYTIPFEDVFYGMLLMLGNVAGLEWKRGVALKKRSPIFN